MADIFVSYTSSDRDWAFWIAKELQAQELIMGASNKFTADEQLDQISFFWISLHDGQTPPLTVRVMNRERDMYLDLNGGNRIPKISERKARSVAELRAAGVGVDRVLLVHSGASRGSDLFQDVLTMLDPEVALDLVAVVPASTRTAKAAQLSAGRNLLIPDIITSPPCSPGRRSRHRAWSRPCGARRRLRNRSILH